MRSVAEQSSDLSRSLGAEQQEQEHASIVLIDDAGRTTRRRRAPEYRGRTRVACRRDYRRRRRDSPGGVAPSTQREQGNENDDETEVPSVADAVVLGACPQGARWGQALSRHDPVTPRDEPTRFSHAAPPTAQGKQLSRSASTAARQSAHYSEHDRRAPQRNGFSVSRARNTQLFLTTSRSPPRWMLARTESIWSAKRTERRHGTTPRPGGSLGKRPRRGGLLDGHPRWPRSRRTKLRAAATRSAWAGVIHERLPLERGAQSKEPEAAPLQPRPDRR